MHTVLAHDLKHGFYWGKDSLEFDIEANGDEVTLNLYEPDSWLVSYSFPDRESAGEDMKVMTEQYGIELRPYEDFATQTNKIIGMGYFKKAK